MEEIVQSLVTCISDITTLADGIRTEKKIFMEFTNHLKQTLAIVLEVQRKHESIPNSVKLLDLLFNKIDFAKDLVYRCSKEEDSMKESEIKGIIRLLEGVTINIGEDLQSIPSSSAFEHETYIRINIQSLSKEMMGAKIFHQSTATQEHQVKRQGSTVERHRRSRSQEQHQVEQQQQQQQQEQLTVQPPPPPPSPPPPLIEEEGNEGSDLYPPVNDEDNNDQEPIQEDDEEEEEEDEEEEDIVPESLNGNKSHPRLGYFLRGMHYSGRNDVEDQSFSTIVQRSEPVEPLYDTFFCPLTGRIMEDPVTLRSSGITYERKAITEWLTRFAFDDDEGNGSSEEVVVCPTTGRRLETRAMVTNLALKSTIEEWIRRNGTTRMKVARSVLSEARSKNAMIKAMGELKLMCRKRKFGRKEICDLGFLPLLSSLLEFDDTQVRCEALQTLTFLVEDQKAKEIVASSAGGAVASAVKMLCSSDEKQEQDASVSFLLELSKSERLIEKIGSVPGAVRMLVTLKRNQKSTFNPSTSEKAGLILKNFEKNPKNIRCMAENGCMETLLDNLATGSRKMRTDMARLLGEVVVHDVDMDVDMEVARRASPILLDMTHSRDPQSRQTAFKALLQISSHRPIGKILIEVGLIQAMMKEVFLLEDEMKKDRPVDVSRRYAAVILSNLVESVSDPDQVMTPLTSDDVTAKLANMVRPTTPDDLNISFIEILIPLTKFKRTGTVVVNTLQGICGIYLLLDFLNHRNERLGIVSLRLLINLCPYAGPAIADTICNTRGQVDLLLEKMMVITDKAEGEEETVAETQVFSAELLSALPHKDLMLNRALVDKNTIEIVLNTMKAVCLRMSGGHVKAAYLEGLVGILVRFTTTLDDVRITNEAQKHGLAKVFTRLLTRTNTIESDEIQRLAAVGLANLSSQSTALSIQGTIAVPNSSTQRRILLLAKCCIKTSTTTTTVRCQRCPIHRGVCSSSTTFCLLESGAIEKLIRCLKHENVRVIEASLSAIVTLLDHRMDVDVSLNLLAGMDIVQLVLQVLTTDHRKDEVWRHALFIVDMFLMRGGADSINQICINEELRSALLAAMQHGDDDTRKLTERILRNISTKPHNTALL